MGKRSPYTREIKQEAIRLVESGQSKASVARKLGLIDQTVADWVKASRQGTLSLGISEMTKEALLRRDHLLFLWLLTLPWRQRNLRECRVGKRNAGANIFNDFVEDNIATSPGVNDQGNKVWQFHFSTSETKNHEIAKGVLAERLIAPLEEYLQRWRPILLEKRKCDEPLSDKLFVNESGKSLSMSDLTRLVGDITQNTLPKRLTPHAFRHHVAKGWLEDHPRDFWTLSKILWHSSLKTTMKHYAAGFNESNGAVLVDQWFKEMGEKGIQDVHIGTLPPCSEQHRSVEEAVLKRNQLILLWLTTLPWEQRYIVGCRISGKSPRANILKHTVDDTIAKPAWVKKLDASTEVWQFYFSPQETRRKQKIKGILPERLIGPLVDYVDNWRPILLGSHSCSNLFITAGGRPLSSAEMTTYVGSLLLLHLDKRSTLREFRHFFATAWIKFYPKDYVVLSKILWHADPETTERFCDDRADVSSAIGSVDHWYRELQNKAQQVTI